MRASHWEPNFPDPTKGTTTPHVFQMPPSPLSAIAAGYNEHRPLIHSKIVELSLYRKQRQRSYWGYSEKLALNDESNRSNKLADQFRYSGSDKNYLERMKMNAAIFVFIIFFVAAGVWLMNGLEQAFGPLH
jgi:hypothetical protein